MKKHQKPSAKHQGANPPRTLTPKGRKPKRKALEQLPDPSKAKPSEFKSDNAETILPMLRRALELYGFKFAYWEIADTLKDEYKLEKAPSEATVFRWCEEARAAYLHDIKALQGREVADQLQACDQLLKVWLPRANGQVHVRRFKMVDGERVEEIDEEAIDEQTKAAGVVLKTMEKKANILGIQDGDFMPKTEGEKTADQIHAFLHKLATQFVTNLPQAKARDINAPVLELESGVENLEGAA